MTTYIITEKRDIRSVREGFQYDAKNLASAKRHASRTQVFFGTALTVGSATGEILSVKEKGTWRDEF